MKNYEGIYNRYIKRILDFITAIILTILLLPLFLFITVVIRISSGPPVLYISQRGGYQGKTFSIYKFRTMIRNADQLGGGTTAFKDKRITKVGHFLRNTKLDEIPQLLNIIKGEMSFVGPRPELVKYTSNYKEEEEIILKVRPGITDYSSIEYINLGVIVGENNAEEVYEKEILPKKNKLRMKYARRVSFGTDCHLIIITLVKIIRIIFCNIIDRE